MYCIENEYLVASFIAKGAEQKSLIEKETKREYMWKGDPSFWGKTAPVLFPFIGKVKDGRYFHQGEEYAMTKHGFARDLDFDVAERKNHMIEFILKHSEKTLEMYPFEFSLRIRYELFDKSLKTTFIVKNMSDGIMKFSLGAHPAFNFDWMTNPCFIEFDETERLFAKELNLDTGLMKESFRDMGYKKSLKLKESDLDKDALIFKDLSSKQLILTDIIEDKSLKFSFEGFKYLAFWSPLAPFICIEPWCGIADYETHNGVLGKKTGIEVLKVDETFERSFTIEIL